MENSKNGLPQRRATDVRPVGTAELPQNMRPDRTRQHTQEAITDMRDFLGVQRESDLFTGTLIADIPDQALNDDRFIDLTLSEQAQAINEQKLMLLKLGIQMDDEQLKLATLPTVVRHVSQKIEAETQYTELAKLLHTDALTGLKNRFFYEGVLRDKVETALQSGQNVTEVALDVDFFKHINDNYGHEVGDEVLRNVAVVLDKASSEIRVGDASICRVGGDEIRLVFTGPDTERVINILRDIQQATPFLLNKYPLVVDGVNVPYTSFSMGYSASHGRKQLTHKLLGIEADCAAYDAKAMGKDLFALFNPRIPSKAPEKIIRKLHEAQAEARQLAA